MIGFISVIFRSFYDKQLYIDAFTSPSSSNIIYFIVIFLAAYCSIFYFSGNPPALGGLIGSLSPFQSGMIQALFFILIWVFITVAQGSEFLDIGFRQSLSVVCLTTIPAMIILSMVYIAGFYIASIFKLASNYAFYAYLVGFIVHLGYLFWVILLTKKDRKLS